jgi:Zn-finger nucleic acid-binding protein
MSDRQGIEIDYCPQCRGVWLDRGELDKIIERSAQDAPAAANRGPGPYERERDRPRQHGDDDGRHRDDRPQGKRRGSFFEGLFD